MFSSVHTSQHVRTIPWSLSRSCASGIPLLELTVHTNCLPHQPLFFTPSRLAPCDCCPFSRFGSPTECCPAFCAKRQEASLRCNLRLESVYLYLSCQRAIQHKFFIGVKHFSTSNIHPLTVSSGFCAEVHIRIFGCEDLFESSVVKIRLGSHFFSQLSTFCNATFKHPFKIPSIVRRI